MLSLRLRMKRGVVVINVPYHIEAYVKEEADVPEESVLSVPLGSASKSRNFNQNEFPQNGSVVSAASAPRAGER